MLDEFDKPDPREELELDILATLLRRKPAAGVVAVRDGFGPGAAWHWVLSAAAVTAKIA